MSDWRQTAPDWFRSAVESPWERRYVESGGAKVHYRLRGAADAPGIVLCHGNAAHSGWWDFIAPAIAETHRVAAMDFAGMGDSEERRTASPEAFAEDIAQVIAEIANLAVEESKTVDATVLFAGIHQGLHTYAYSEDGLGLNSFLDYLTDV